MKMKLVSLNKSKIVYEKVLVVKSVHDSEDSLRKVSEILIKFREFNCSTGYLVFLCNMKLISFFCYMQIVNPMGRIASFCYLLLGYSIRDNLTLH